MAFQAVPDTAEIVVQYIGNTKNMVSTMAATKLGGYNLTDLNLLSSAVDVAVAANWLPRQTLDYTYTQTVVRGLAFENDLVSIDNTSSGVGLNLGPALSGNVTFSVKKASGLTGRSARGRLFWLGIVKPDLQDNENLLTVVASDLIVAAIEAVRVAIAATVWDPVIVSRFNAGVKRPFGIVNSWITTSAVNINVDSQRGRLIR